MKTVLILIVMVVALYVLWTLWESLIKNKIKNKQHSILNLHPKEMSKNIEEQQNEDDLPEKSKQIKQHLDQERRNIVVMKQLAEEQQNDSARLSTVIDEVSHEDQRLFDDAAQLFFQQALKVTDINQAGEIQQKLLTKMPLSTQSQSGSFDFGEWAIYWHYHDQSLEYYVGRYGIFYTHVDHEGREHKLEFRQSTS